MDFQMYPCDSRGEEVCPICGMNRGPEQPEDSWQFHMAMCYSIQESEDMDNGN